MRKSFKHTHLHRFTMNSYIGVETPFQLSNVDNPIDFQYLSQVCVCLCTKPVTMATCAVGDSADLLRSLDYI